MDTRIAQGGSGGFGTRRVSRRSVIRFGLALAALPILAACNSQASAPSSSTGSSNTPVPAPTSTRPPAAAASPSPIASPIAAASPVPGGSPVASAPGVSTGISTPPAPTFNKVAINGKLSVIVDQDFYPAHNAFIEQKVREFADMMGYPLDFSTVAAYTGVADISQKLAAAVQSGDSPDCITHTEATTELHFLDVLDDVDDLQKQIINDFGQPYKAFISESLLDGKWYAVQHFSRAGGYWVRQNVLQAAGLDYHTALADWDMARDSLLKASKPDQQSWGWGMTVNRSGDGETVVKEQILSRGGQLCDETGQICVLNTDPYRQYAIDALTFLKDIYQNSQYAAMVPTGVGSWTDPSNNEAYLAGKVFFTSNAGTMYAQAVNDKNPVADDTYLMLPPKGTGPGARSIASGGAAKRWFVIKGAKNPEAAQQLIRYMCSADVQKQLFQISNGYVYPAYQWGWDQPELTSTPAAAHVTDVWRQYLTHPSGYTGDGSWPAPPNAWVASLESSNFWTDMMGEVLTGKSPADAVASAHDRAVGVFQQFGAKGSQ